MEEIFSSFWLLNAKYKFEVMLLLIFMVAVIALIIGLSIKKKIKERD